MNLRNSIHGGDRIITVYGIRRIDKTSLVNVSPNEAETPYVLIADH
ncbi:hypothetical protein [Vulcanisaeta souniana]|uniref:Uncharacterized protein n=1 Tax=Vulcanisaeta souniana JCM 11219 TaxID=1293586 RepID=A0ABM8BLI9_9CREN|nr:hypothetical protein [Vulcanisaeta souniana]BDR91867.1 hypothetical protein Vsou_09600 [Vulcanisaeta souniana JCM 11219]